IKEMKTLLRKHQSNIALVIGNGINRYDPAKATNSWDDLLVKLAEKHLQEQFHSVPNGVALTEFYDILELKFQKSISKKSLPQEFCDLMESWKCYEHHMRIVKWAQEADAPILTTNFEQVLSDAGKCTLYRTKKSGFTDYYPWETYFGSKEISDPSQEFGIWHVNGMQRYSRSIRLGLTHYMGSVERARGWLLKGNERRLFSGKNDLDWDGAAFWLHIVFNTPLLIFGLSLEENEVFFRWLLIERARYFKIFPERRKSAWYINVRELNNYGKQLFLERVGVQPISVASFDEIYGAETWS
ncbi:hypothetical protein ACFL5H_03920, partial [Candidatus Latescibacterota bacterium]